MWHPATPKPTRRGTYLLRLSDGDYAVDSCYVPGGEWMTLRTVTHWARLT